MAHILSEQLLKLTWSTINSAAFQAEAKTAKNHFTRKRIMLFADYILYFLRHAGLSTAVGLNAFFMERYHQVKGLTKQAFSKQRQFIKPEALQMLFQLTVSLFYKTADYETFHGYILAAIDGSRCNLPCSKELAESFGAQVSQGAPQNQALISGLYDVLNKIYLDATINPLKSSERNLAISHLDVLTEYNLKKVILLMDRGYPSFALINEMSKRNVKFVLRCDKSFVKGMKLTGWDCCIDHKFSKSKEAVRLRVVRFKVGDTEEILVTNLIEPEFSIDVMKKLYNLRWGIETSYNHLKNHIEVENFSGNTAIAIRQDFFAAMYMTNYAGIVIFEMRSEFNAAHNCGKNLRIYQQNFAITVGILKCGLIGLLTSSAEAANNSLLDDFCDTLLRYSTPIRPGRSTPRKVTHKMDKFPNSKKRV